jgi:hypothetical protein
MGGSTTATSSNTASVSAPVVIPSGGTVSISTNTGVNPFCKTEATSDIHVSGGTITSPPSGCFIFKTAIVSRFAEAPEFTKTL